jgi:hypothetical protein
VNQLSGRFQLDGGAGRGDAMDLNRAVLSVEAVGPWEVTGGDTMLPAVDGGIGHEKREGEITPLLAMLMPPIEPWLLRGLGKVGEGDRG